MEEYIFSCAKKFKNCIICNVL